MIKLTNKIGSLDNTQYTFTRHDGQEFTLTKSDVHKMYELTRKPRSGLMNDAMETQMLVESLEFEHRHGEVIVRLVKTVNKNAIYVIHDDGKIEEHFSGLSFDIYPTNHKYYRAIMRRVTDMNRKFPTKFINNMVKADGDINMFIGAKKSQYQHAKLQNLRRW